MKTVVRKPCIPHRTAGRGVYPAKSANVLTHKRGLFSFLSLCLQSPYLQQQTLAIVLNFHVFNFLITTSKIFIPLYLFHSSLKTKETDKPTTKLRVYKDILVGLQISPHNTENKRKNNVWFEILTTMVLKNYILESG
jgi:hypothetical protein